MCAQGVILVIKGFIWIAGKSFTNLGLSHKADGRLTARSREVSKPRESGLNFSNGTEIWQAPRQQRCLDAIEDLSSYPKIVSSSCRMSSCSQIFCIIPLCGTSVQITIYVQNGKGSQNVIETSTERPYIIVLWTARKGQPPSSLYFTYEDYYHGNFQMFNKYQSEFREEYFHC